MRRPLLRIAPLTLLAVGLLLAPAANVTASDSIATYRAPTRLTPGWGPADAPQVISYLGGQIHSAPPGPDMHPAIDALTAARVVDASFSGDIYERTAEVSLRVVWFSEESHFLIPLGSYHIKPGEKRLMYVILQHDHTPGGAGIGGYRPNLPPQPTRDLRCGVITFVDANTGELVYNGGQVICGYPSLSNQQ